MSRASLFLICITVLWCSDEWFPDTRATCVAGQETNIFKKVSINYPNNRSKSLGDLSSVDKILMKYFDWAHMDRQTQLSAHR